MDKFRRADGYLFDTNGKFALVFVKFARLFADFLDAKFTLLFAKFYESRFFTQAKFDAKFIPHKSSCFLLFFIKIRAQARIIRKIRLRINLRKCGRKGVKFKPLA